MYVVPTSVRIISKVQFFKFTAEVLIGVIVSEKEVAEVGNRKCY